MIEPLTLIQLAREYPDINPTALYERCKDLARLSKRHHTLAEWGCNETGSDDGVIERCERRIALIAESDFRGMAVVFNRDPRGATVKLVVPSGATNDWGREGLCVLA